jgi:hypothetical protein
MGAIPAKEPDMDDQKPPVGPNAASGFERLQHDIEELERPVGRDSTVPWILGIVAFLVLMGLFLVVVQ